MIKKEKEKGGGGKKKKGIRSKIMREMEKGNMKKIKKMTEKLKSKLNRRNLKIIFVIILRVMWLEKNYINV